MAIKNVFLDRDGTIIQDMHYLSNPEQIVFIPGAIAAMREMKESGLDIFLVTNQSGIGRGYFTLDDHRLVQDRLCQMLTDKGIRISDSLFCPHKPDDKCGCRKPETGMWDMISARHGLRAEESVIIGDKLSDIAFGRNCGFKASVLTLTGHGLKSMEMLGLTERPLEWSEPEPRPDRPTALALDIHSAWTWVRQRLINDI